MSTTEHLFRCFRFIMASAPLTTSASTSAVASAVTIVAVMGRWELELAKRHANRVAAELDTPATHTTGGARYTWYTRHTHHTRCAPSSLVALRSCSPTTTATAAITTIIALVTICCSVESPPLSPSPFKCSFADDLCLQTCQPGLVLRPLCPCTLFVCTTTAATATTCSSITTTTTTTSPTRHRVYYCLH